MTDYFANLLPSSAFEKAALLIGALAQLCFSARILIQWIMSEKAKRVVSPAIFWILSIMGSYLFFIYGWMREDFAILFGQFISYYIYLWNIKVHKDIKPWPFFVHLLLAATPFIALMALFMNQVEVGDILFKNDQVPLWLLFFGSFGQFIFTFRFVYQFIYSKRNKESTLPLGFWLLSFIGSAIIITYGAIRSDIILMVGQSFGFIAYLRNIMLLSQQKRRDNLKHIQ